MVRVLACWPREVLVDLVHPMSQPSLVVTPLPTITWSHLRSLHSWDGQGIKVSLGRLNSWKIMTHGPKFCRCEVFQWPVSQGWSIASQQLHSYSLTLIRLEVGCGVRQGCPLAPILFVLAVNALTWCNFSTCWASILEGFLPGPNRGLLVSLLQYVDYHRGLHNGTIQSHLGRDFQSHIWSLDQLFQVFIHPIWHVQA